MGFVHADDGITHINVHPVHGATDLGRTLSTFAYTPFSHPYYGKFNCLEGFWHFIRNEERDDKLRYVSHNKALELGKKGKVSDYPEFREDVIGAMYQKIIQDPALLKEFCESELPFDMYYIYGPAHLLISPKWNGWLVPGLEELRVTLRNGAVPDAWVRAEKRYASGNLRR